MNMPLGDTCRRKALLWMRCCRLKQIPYPLAEIPITATGQIQLVVLSLIYSCASASVSKVMRSGEGLPLIQMP